MLFPFPVPRNATFHMGRVAFPIDIIFVDAAGKVGRVVSARPGARERWSHVASCVVEVPIHSGIRVGEDVHVADHRVGAQTYNLLRTITEAEKEAAPLMEGYYSKEPHHQHPPDISGTDPKERYKDRKLPDEWSNAEDNPGAHWKQNSGWPAFGYEDEYDEFAVRPGWRRSGRDVVELDLSKFIPSIVEGAVRSGLDWAPNPADPNEERLVISEYDVGNWTHALGMGEAEREYLHDIVTSPNGLDIVGAGFIAAEQANTAKVVEGPDNFLVLTRSKTWIS